MMKREQNISRFPRSMTVLALIITIIIIGPIFLKYDFVTHDLHNAYQAPDHHHLMGTDKFGRDVLARVLHGGRISLWVAFLSASLSLVIGLPIGLLAGYMGKMIDSIINSIIHIFMAVPQFLLILSIVAVLGRNSVFWVVIIVAMFSWMDIARLARNQALSLKEKEFIVAEKVLGVPRLVILFKHVMPNLMGPVLVAVTLLFGNVILIESALSFIGLGIQPPMPSWGNIINDGRQVLLSGWWISVFPGLFIIMTVLAVNMFGEYMQERWFSS